MKKLVLESWTLLLYVEIVMKYRGYYAVNGAVRRQCVCISTRFSTPPYEQLCRAIDNACVFYFKRVLCLQRSGATAILLKRHGWNAEMVTGAQVLPFKSHAWVEIGGEIVSDKPYMHEIYQVLERC
jgi:hypothetical protein